MFRYELRWLWAGCRRIWLEAMGCCCFARTVLSPVLLTPVCPSNGQRRSPASQELLSERWSQRGFLPPFP